MSYANSESIRTRLKSVSEDITDELITEAITTSDNTINAELIREGVSIPTRPPTDSNDLQVYNLLVSAGNLLAVADITNVLYDTINGERSPTARANEEKAYNLINHYIDQKQNATRSGNKYSITTIDGDSLRDVLNGD